MSNELTPPPPPPPPSVSSAVQPAAPVLLDRAALERVLARAAELHAGEVEPTEGMSEAQLVALAGEVGIAPEYIRQALAEERTRVNVPEARGLVGEVFGSDTARASRIVRGTPEKVLESLHQWMLREESLRIKRRFTDRLTWEARHDFVDNVLRAFNFSGRAYALKVASEVSATVAAVDAERTLVRLDAVLADSRRRAIVTSASAASLGALGGTGLIAWSASFPGSALWIAAAVGGASAGMGGLVAYAVASVQRRRLAKAQLALEQILDRLEHGEVRRPHPFVDLIATMTR